MLVLLVLIVIALLGYAGACLWWVLRALPRRREDFFTWF